jgi:hypothetical protein
MRSVVGGSATVGRKWNWFSMRILLCVLWLYRGRVPWLGMNTVWEPVHDRATRSLIGAHVRLETLGHSRYLPVSTPLFTSLRAARDSA